MMHANLGLPKSLQRIKAGRTRPSTLERMPKWLICVPLTIQWLLLSLRYGSLTLPSAANPGITSGGLIGEGKLEYFSAMGPVARRVTARYCAIAARPKASRPALYEAMKTVGLSFPVIAKPDLGLCGYGVRLLGGMDELQDYVEAFPADETLILQQYLPQNAEAGLFYVREPGAEAGRIIGLALRYFPRVTGDGICSLAQLIALDPRAGKLLDSAFHECTHDGARIPANGEVVRLATIGSTRVGALYRDGAECITSQLEAAIEAIARDIPDFHFGRFDVRFDSLQELAAGRGFTIMEVNGAGSEAIQAWDPDTGLLAAFTMIFHKQNILFAIGAAMRRRGTRPMGVLELFRLNRRQQQLIAAYPLSN